MAKKVKVEQEEWFEVTLVTSVPLTAGDSDTVTSPPSDLALLGDAHVVPDEFEGMCSGCGEPVAPHPRGGWVHVGPSDPWHPQASQPLGPLLAPETEPEPDWIDVPLWAETTTCLFGHTGSRVNACERDAVDGSRYCAVHIDDE